MLGTLPQLFLDGVGVHVDEKVNEKRAGDPAHSTGLRVAKASKSGSAGASKMNAQVRLWHR